MPNRYPKDEIFEHYEKLPEELKDALTSVNISDQLFEIGKKINLTVEKMGLMAEEIGYVILGFTKPQEFTSLLQKNLEVDIELASQIASEINRKIFLPLREALKQAHQVEIQMEAGQYGADRKQEVREETTTTMPQPKPPQPPISPEPPILKLPEQPKPAEPAKPMPINLRDFRKPAINTPLPEIIGPAKYSSEIPKPSELKPPEPPKPIIPKPVAPPKPEVMSNGGMFAAPITNESSMTNHVSRGEKPKLSQPQNQPKEFKENPHKFDPYREPIE